MKLLAGALVGMMVLGMGLYHSQAQTPEPLYVCQPVQTFTCQTLTPSATLTTVSLPSATLIPTLTRPALTPTYDFATHTTFQTATAIKQANLTQEAKWTLAAPFNTPSQEVWTETPTAPAGVRYTVLTAKGLNERQTPSVTAPILRTYSVGVTVVVYGDLIPSGGYEWGKTATGYVAVKSGQYIFMRKQ